MKSSKIVKCPWCGEEMKMGHTYIFWYECNRCRATSPIADSEEEVYEAALRRPLQKPMTLEEIKESAFCAIEYADFYDGNYPKVLGACCINHEFDDGFNIAIANEFDDEDFFAKEDYGVVWRCWASKPTDEEREAAKWEG